MTTPRPTATSTAAARRDGAHPHAAAGSFNARSRAAIGDTFLHDALALGTGRLARERTARMWELPDAPELRARAYAIKRETMAHLDAYLAQAADAVERLGGRVYFARDGAEAVRYVSDVIAAHGARTVVKSKSMVSEEIALDARLATLNPGVDVVETDLGEWIAQLAHDTPSHIIAPIIHMNRFQVAEVLSREAGEPLSPTVEDLMAFARERLRQRFLAADIGISGANFVVAETGSVALVTNEGNGRLTTSLPRVHIALAGIEKLVPRLDDLGVFLQLLARSGTGQQLTVYTHLVTGPRQAGDADGPDEFHLVLLDNGRSDILGSAFEEVLYCIRCGACQNVCPVYRQTGGHAYAATYAGPIGAVLTPLLRRDRAAWELPYASSLCGACSEVCPVGIPLHHLLLELRQEAVRRGIEGPVEGLLMRGFAAATERPALFNLARRGAQVGERPLTRGGTVRALPGAGAAWTATRDLPPVAARSFAEQWKAGIADG